MKQLVNILGATCGLILIAPFYPLIALAIKLNSRGPVLVKLKRISAGQEIYVYKFRSMIDDAHNLKSNLQSLNERTDGPFFKMRRDPRVTKVGRYLRKCRVDEFPQLINVLRGELNLVGPRPHEPEEVKNYPLQFQHLISAKAGVTGYSQVNGASSLPFLKELELDNYYLKNPSLWLDLKIIAKTLMILFTDRNAV